MNVVSLFVSLALFVLWIINLATAGGPAWFTWLVFVCAAVLLISSLTGFGVTSRKIGRTI